MKKYSICVALIIALASCNDTSNNTKTNASATDSTQTPNGMSNGSVISVDTAATRIDTTQHK